jgi:hypothetical protein
MVRKYGLKVVFICNRVKQICLICIFVNGINGQKPIHNYNDPLFSGWMHVYIQLLGFFKLPDGIMGLLYCDVYVLY